ncbi:MAG: hypothetical protein JNL98_33365 [Bryobacterales bacterium]|nr:hypothetical protein [Bryobacterales bacterium]
MRALLSLLWMASIASAQQTCTFALNPTSRTVPATPDTIGTLTVTASASNCARTAVSDRDWLTISFGTPGTGNGTIGYRVEVNRTAAIRTGTITVGNATFSVTQAAADCTVDLSPLSSRVTRAGGRGTVRVTTRCDWNATTTATWLVLANPSGSGDGSFDYSYSENSGTDTRIATINVGNRAFVLTQDGAPCTTTINPTSADFASDGGTGTANVVSSCTWRAVPSQAWITLTGSDSATGNGAVSYRVAPNTATQARAGVITIGNQTLQVRQAATDLPVITGITNAASFARDSASPGSVIAVFGARLGPAQLVTAQLTPDGQALMNTLAGTRVLVDGTPAPLIYSFESVVSAVVPYNTEGKRSVRVAVEREGRRSAEYTLPVAATAPGVFTADASGRGGGAILNQDLTLNTASNPAERGSTIVIYATGEGVTNPPGVDGKLNGPEPPQPLAPVLVSVGGAVAAVTYKGGVSGVTPGLLQINAVLSQATPVGAAIPVIVNIGGVVSQNGVTVAVR